MNKPALFILGILMAAGPVACASGTGIPPAPTMPASAAQATTIEPTDTVVPTATATSVSTETPVPPTATSTATAFPTNTPKPPTVKVPGFPEYGVYYGKYQHKTLGPVGLVLVNKPRSDVYYALPVNKGFPYFDWWSFQMQGNGGVYVWTPNEEGNESSFPTAQIEPKEKVLKLKLHLPYSLSGQGMGEDFELALSLRGTGKSALYDTVRKVLYDVYGYTELSDKYISGIVPDLP